MTTELEVQTAVRELADSLLAASGEWATDATTLIGPQDFVDAHHAIAHYLSWGFDALFQRDANHPRFTRIFHPGRSLLGDNPDVIYFDAPVSPEREYRVTGETKGAEYVSITVEAGTVWGAIDNVIVGVINDEGFDVDDDGWFTVTLGGPRRPRNWIALPDGASSITTRHYFETTVHAQSDPARVPTMRIEAGGGAPVPPRPSDGSLAEGFRRVTAYLRAMTLDRPPLGQGPEFSWVSTVPNVFNPPAKPGNLGLAAADAAYGFAPFVLAPDEALVMQGSWPDCRYGSVSLWNRFLQMFDYTNRSVSLNRAQTVADDDGRFTIVLAHDDPGVPNWLDTEGRAFGIVYWRFMLPDGAIETPVGTVVKLEEVRR
jgi:hypothetical protein